MASCERCSDLLYRPGYPYADGWGNKSDVRFAEREKKERLDASTPENANESPLFSELIVSGEKLPRRNRWATLGSVVAELLLLVAAIVIPLYHTDALPEMRSITTLYLQPPPAALHSAPKVQLPPKAPTSYNPSSISIPSPVRAAQEAPPPVSSATAGVEGGIPGGVVGGIPRGVLGVIQAAPRNMPILAKNPESAPVKRIRVGARVAEANLIHDVPPQYPQEAGRARIEGTVVLLAVISTDGSVKEVQVESGLPVLARAAIDAVKQWRYKPYTIDGQPVEVDSRITINFTLSAS